MRQLLQDRRGATAVEYALLLALLALVLVSVLPDVAHSLCAAIVTAREGMKDKVCEGDPTASGIQCR